MKASQDGMLTLREIWTMKPKNFSGADILRTRTEPER